MIHHPEHGIGRVQKVGKRKFAGSGDDDFAQLYFRRERLTLIVPADALADTVRQPLTARQAGEVLDYIKHWEGRVSKQWKARAAANQDAIERGDPYAYAEVCKGLSQLESEGSLRHTDRAHLNRSFDFLADELAHALDETPDYARMLITEALGD
jgi:RNA polymerase-interacting CarD/CdnL/TRCF family regulator